MTREQAARVALAHANDSFGPIEGDEILLIEDQTIERDYGWVFFYNTRGYLGGDIMKCLMGNGPILVCKDGTLHGIPSGLFIDDALARFEQGKPFID